VNLTLSTITSVIFAVILLVARRRIRGLRAALAEQTWRAEHDQLTRLPNRHVLHAALGQWLQQHRPIAVCMLDIDDFKQINDLYGYAAGDALLVFAADRLTRAAADTGGLAVRLGGDEFLLAWPDVDTATAQQHAATAVQMVTSRPALIRHRSLPLPISGGLAYSNGLDDLSTSRLLAHADEARVHAETTGKNRLVTWHSQLPTAQARIHGGRPAMRLRDTA